MNQIYIILLLLIIVIESYSVSAECGMIVLDLDIPSGLPALIAFLKYPAFLMGLLVVVIISIHSIFCHSHKFFWKFAFLLPEEFYYYVFANNKLKHLDIKIYNSEHISSLTKYECRKNDKESYKGQATKETLRCRTHIPH
jgi:hypothetical protein